MALWGSEPAKEYYDKLYCCELWAVAAGDDCIIMFCAFRLSTEAKIFFGDEVVRVLLLFWGLTGDSFVSEELIVDGWADVIDEGCSQITSSSVGTNWWGLRCTSWPCIAFRLSEWTDAAVLRGLKWIVKFEREIRWVIDWKHLAIQSRPTQKGPSHPACQYRSRGRKMGLGSQVLERAHPGSNCNRKKINELPGFNWGSCSIVVIDILVTAWCTKILFMALIEHEIVDFSHTLLLFINVLIFYTWFSWLHLRLCSRLRPLLMPHLSLFLWI